MNHRNLRRTFLRVGALSAALGSGLGCAPQSEIEIAGGEFTAAFTLDRQPVDVDANGQPTADPSLGPYTRAPGFVASLMFPDLSGIEGLFQADCFWAARDPSGGGDLLRLNWEVYALVTGQVDGKYLPQGDEDISSCRLNDPLTRQFKHFSAPNAPAAPTVVVSLPNAISVSTPRIEDGVLISDNIDLAFENGGEAYGAFLRAVRPASLNPDRTCNLGDFSGSPVTIGPGTWSYDAGSDEDGRVALCSGRGRTVIPPEDARFRISLEDGGMSAVQWFDAVLVAQDGERIVRPGAAQGNGVAWSVATSPGRWHENFSPSIRVDEVRLLRRSGGREIYLKQSDLASQSLCVRAAPGNTGCLHELASAADAALRAVWRPLAPQPGDSPARLTPGYDADLLGALAPGEAIADPLEWIVVPKDPSGVLFEFRLTVMLAPIAVRIDALAHFGQVPPGETRHRRLTVTNFGGRSVSIDTVSVIPDGTDPSEFAVMVLGDPQPVPVGVEFISEESVAVKLAPDYWELPVYRAEEYETAALLLENDLDGEAFEVNGHRLNFDGPTALHTSAGADFRVPLASDTTRPLNLISHLPLTLPQTVAPGEHLGIRVRFRPGPPGERSGTLRVEYHDPADGTPGVIEAAILATAMWGPDPAVLPEILILDDSGPGQDIRNLLLMNNGDLPLRVYDHAVIGPDYDRINVLAGPPASFQVAPAQFQDFTLQYLDLCAPPGQIIDQHAELWLDTDVGEISVPIRMRSLDC